MQLEKCIAKLGWIQYGDTSVPSLWLKNQDMDFRFYEVIALSDQMNKFVLFHMHEVQTLAQLKYYCSLLFTCPERSLRDMKAVFGI